ncbi:MAG: hypothetical protein KGK08_05140 [Acidobacteriota bacterium]|nr:hypothetical protein [Acidobacteriota bacterium]
MQTKQRLNLALHRCCTRLRRERGSWQRGLALLALVLLPVVAHASVALLMEEPYGEFGAFNPTGHAAVYLSNICAQTPTELRPCRRGEYGSVISRYHKIHGYDWLAMPLVPYLYGVDNVRDVPMWVDRERVALLRDQYRRRALLAIAPNRRNGGTPDGEWTQLVGASFDRTIHGFQVQSTSEQDERFIAIFNDRRNVGHFNLLFHNCADFSRVVLDTYFPDAIHRNFVADVGLMTPKQVARSLVKYGRSHPELGMTAFVIPQVPGTIARSHPVDGVAESLVKSKRYLLPLAVLNPELTATVVAAYLVDGRLALPKDAPYFEIDAAEVRTAPRRLGREPDSLPAGPDVGGALKHGHDSTAVE